MPRALSRVPCGSHHQRQRPPGKGGDAQGLFLGRTRHSLAPKTSHGSHESMK